jgi:hypothetical protein
MHSRLISVLAVAVVCLVYQGSFAQQVVAKKSSSWSMAGRIQLQHLYNTNTSGDADQTNNGFRIRRGRFQVLGMVTDQISTNFQMEVRDNSPRILDAEGKLALFDDFFLRVGQFKVPVWREELRSSGSLLLVERSAVAEFLVEYNLSARQIGVEFGGQLGQTGFAVNYSNGAGEGGREDAGRTKSDVINNGKLLTARILVPTGDIFQLGVSGAINSLGNHTHDINDRGSVYAIAPDFGIYLPSGVDIEGGLVIGSVSKDFTGREDDSKFTLADATCRWKSKLSAAQEALAGLDAWELAAGISHVEPDKNIDNDEATYFRFGPAFYFGHNTRLQVNAEIEDSKAVDETILQIRSQMTINF